MLVHNSLIEKLLQTVLMLWMDLPLSSKQINTQHTAVTCSTVAAAKPAGPAPTTTTRPTGLDSGAAAASLLAFAAALTAAAFSALALRAAAALYGSITPL